MATKGHIAAVQERALQDLEASSEEMAAALNIEPPDLTMFYRDADLLHAEQLRALADFQQRVVAALAQQQADKAPTGAGKPRTSRKANN